MRKDLNFPSDIGNLRLVEKAIDELSLELDLSDEIYGNVLVSTMEATNNAIIHGNLSDPQKEVKIEIECVEKELMVHVEDQGKGFDHMNVPDPTAPENIEKINGLPILENILWLPGKRWSQAAMRWALLRELTAGSVSFRCLELVLRGRRFPTLKHGEPSRVS